MLFQQIHKNKKLFTICFKNRNKKTCAMVICHTLSLFKQFLPRIVQVFQYIYCYLLVYIFCYIVCCKYLFFISILLIFDKTIILYENLKCYNTTIFCEILKFTKSLKIASSFLPHLPLLYRCVEVIRHISGGMQGRILNSQNISHLTKIFS